ncbi:MAG: hypothetical protein HZA11_01520 [Nitrospirae bacterium]|nr:hypothetical protein [Nitrospirota bacterium]
MLTKLLNRLGKWSETMAVAAFAEAGDFTMMEKALAKDKKRMVNVRKRAGSKIHKLTSRPARG